MQKTLNNQIITESFGDRSIETKITSGFASIKQKTTLKALKVLIGNERIAAGSTVYVPGDACRQPFADKIYEDVNVLDGAKFIVVPENFVIFMVVPCDY